MADFHTPHEALAVLGLDANATKDDIRQAYHRLAMRYHPDSAGETEADAGERFLEVHEAYEYLVDAYDRAYEAYVAAQEAARAAATGQEKNYRSDASHAADGSRIIGSDAAMQRARTSRHFAQEKRRQERRLERERARRKQETERMLESYKADRAYEEAMAKIHAIRAAEITLALYEASLKGNGWIRVPEEKE